MNRVLIETEEKRTSEILVGRGVFSAIEEHADFIFTDTNVLALYGEKIAKKFPSAPVWAMPAGEEHKTEETLFRLLEKMKEAELRRGSTLVCVGGGVAGDLGGLAAALYMRGIACVQAPTTLLAQVDSSVGGKTAIDFRGIKNLIGIFSEPKKVYIDGDFLKTLPPREIRCGLGETVKHSALSEKLFTLLWDNRSRLGDLEFLSGLVCENIEIKANVVRRDAREGGERKCLNLGHTTAHAFELVDKKLSHGEYVLIGILYEAEIAKRTLRGADGEYLDRLKELAKIALGGLPDLPSAEEAVRSARFDKKNLSDDKVFLALPFKRGEYAFEELGYGEYLAMLKEIGERLW